jgi:hypothetical protein
MAPATRRYSTLHAERPARGRSSRIPARLPLT